MDPHLRRNIIDCLRGRRGNEGEVSKLHYDKDLICLMHCCMSHSQNRAKYIVGAQQILYKVIIKH